MSNVFGSIGVDWLQSDADSSTLTDDADSSLLTTETSADFSTSAALAASGSETFSGSVALAVTVSLAATGTELDQQQLAILYGWGPPRRVRVDWGEGIPIFRLREILEDDDEVILALET